MPRPFKIQDQYFKKAKAEGYRARSAFKLIEIDDKFKIFKKGQSVLDLGAAPGSWLQVIQKKVGKRGNMVGIDLQEIKALGENVALYQVDIFSELVEDLLIGEKFDVITSDLAPKTSGIKDVDQWKSIELNQAVVELAQKHLKTNGIVILKIFIGADFQDFIKELKSRFKKVNTFKPRACRDRSFETYIICQK